MNGLIDRYYAGMLNCGLDASINDRANHSRLPGGSARYAAAVLVEIARMKQYGYHVKATLSDGTVEEHDIIALCSQSPMHGTSEADWRCLHTPCLMTECWIWCG